MNENNVELGLTNTLVELEICICQNSRVCTFTTTKLKLKQEADLVEIDDGNIIADLAVHVTFIKLTH